jgi:hypothetical protein
LEQDRDGTPETVTSSKELYIPPLPPLQPNLTDRMLWDNPSNDTAEYWMLSEIGKMSSSSTIKGASSGSWATGAAGDHVLWSFPPRLQTVDDKGNEISTVVLYPPADGFQPVGIALASPLAHGCYSKTEQNYYVTWHSTEAFAIQLVAEDGYVRRTVVQAMPRVGLQALWFGYGADGYEWILFRDINGNAYRYRAQLSSTSSPPQYTLSDMRYTRRPFGTQAVSMTAKKRSKLSLTGGTPYNDFILFSSWTGGSAKLLAFDANGDPVKYLFGGSDLVWSYSNAGKNATAYAYIPPLCSQ